MKPKVLVLILSYNGKALLEESVSSYLANDYGNFKVVVIDNGSTDGTKKYVEQHWPTVKLLRTDVNLKYSGGFNLGLQYAFKEEDADYVLITNNDVKADRSIISSCVHVAEQNINVGFVIGKVYYYDNPNVFQTCGREWDDKLWRGNTIGLHEEDKGQYDKVREIAWCDDIFWLVSKKLYDETGGYDEEFAFQAEDFEWQIRARKNGYKIFYSPEAKLWHKESVTIGRVSPFKAYYDFRNPLIAHMMHRSFSEYKYYYQRKRRALFIVTLRNAVRFKFYYCFKCWKGFFSAIRWGLREKRISFKQIFKLVKSH